MSKPKALTTLAPVPTLERPDPALLKYYFAQSLAGLILFPIILVPLYFRFRKLRYAFDEEGVSASWGVFFRREVHLTYARIQDIQVRQNVIERWLGIGRVELQTASGNAAAELVVEGVRDHEALRDFFYARMRGVAEETTEEPASAEPEAVRLLREIREELVGTREALERISQGGGS